MSVRTDARPDYGNWVPAKLVWGPGVIALACLALTFLYRPLLVAFAVFLVLFLYFLYARYEFSPAGRGVQQRVLQMVFSHLRWSGDGLALDIGCGNGPLAIMLAREYPQARIVGTDYWGAKWDYSQGACERNARVVGVGERVSFQKASASKLPFKDGCFDAAVSNLVFHEVADTKDKREVIREALRVVRKGGSFAFQDLFLWKAVYGETDELLSTIRSWGVSRAELVRTSDAPFIPKALRLPFMIGRIGIIKGEK